MLIFYIIDKINQSLGKRIKQIFLTSIYKVQFNKLYWCVNTSGSAIAEHLTLFFPKWTVPPGVIEKVQETVKNSGHPVGGSGTCCS